MNHIKFSICAGLSIALLSGSGCIMHDLSSTSYKRDEAGRVSTVEFGTVESIDVVKVEGTKSGVGAVGGGLLGGVLGRRAGSGRTASDVGKVVGGVGGLLGGAAAEEAVTRQKALQITIKLESGRTIAITQGADITFDIGEKVRVLAMGSANARVQKL